MSAALTVAHLDAYYGRAQALFDVGLDVGAGEAVALIGRNGAGKTTTMRAILGLVRRRSGVVTFQGRDISRSPTSAIVRLGLGYVAEDRRIFCDLTSEENLQVGRQPRRDGAPYWTFETLYDLFPALRELRRRPGARMSGGEQQMLAIARTLMGNPSLLLLDEPAEGLAPRIVDELIEAMVKMKREGLSLLISEQNPAFARRLADRVCLIEKGSTCFFGALADADEAYLAPLAGITGNTGSRGDPQDR